MKEEKPNKEARAFVRSFKGYVISKKIFLRLERLREKYKVPDNGIVVHRKTLSEIKNGYLGYFPRGWELYVNKDRDFKNKYKKLNNELKIIRRKIPLGGGMVDLLLRVWFFHYEIPDNLIHYFNENNLCKLSDEQSELDVKRLDLFLDQLKRESIFYPIFIKISPFTSITEIRSWITANSKKIKEFQSKYQNNPNLIIKKTRSNINFEKILFIYKNHNKKSTEITRLLNEKTPGRRNPVTPDQVRTIKMRWK